MAHSLDASLVRQVDDYIERLFVRRDEALERTRASAEAAGLPAIHVSPNLGKLLYLVARIVRAARILEIGTLAGYSTLWLARALPPDGRLVTLEIDERHAALARENLAHAGADDRVEVRVGPAGESLRAMIAAGQAPFDLVFIDADKERYLEYLELSLQLVRPGSVVVADNLIRNGRVLEDVPPDPQVRAIRAFNEALSVDPRLESLILPIMREKLDGISISVVR